MSEGSLSVEIALFFWILLVIFEFFLLLFLIVIFLSGIVSNFYGAPYVPLPKKIIPEILKFAEFNSNGTFYDLGCGDGRILIEAVRIFGIKKAVGYEVSPWPYLKAKFLIRREKLGDKIKILRQDFFKADLSQADIVFIYLFHKVVEKLAPKFEKELKTGSKIISVSFPIGEPEKFNLKLIKSGKVGRFTTYIYKKI